MVLPCVVGQKAKGEGLFGLIPRLKAALLHPVRHNKPLFAPGVVLTRLHPFIWKCQLAPVLQQHCFAFLTELLFP